MKPGSRIEQLDVLRAVAILLVLGRHPVIEPQTAGLLSAPAEFWHRFGWTGVDLFFVLSGFLIGGLLFNELTRVGTVDVKRFLIRRSFKIWPAYYVLLIFVILVTPLQSDSIVERFSTFVPHLFHLQNYFRDVPLHTWSLAIEEHFYLLLPLLLYVVAKCTSRKPKQLFLAISVITVVVVALCLTLRWLAEVPVEDLGSRLSPTHLRVDSLFWGVFLAALYHLRSAWFTSLSRRRLLLAISGFLLITPMMFLSLETSLFVSTWGYVFLYLGYGCLLIAAVSSQQREVRSWAKRVMVFIGASSYSIYLWHWHLSYAFKRLGSLTSALGVPATINWFLIMLLYISSATVAGWFMARLVEVPMLKLRDRLFPSKASAVLIDNRDRSQAPHANQPALVEPVTGFAN